VILSCTGRGESQRFRPGQAGFGLAEVLASMAIAALALALARQLGNSHAMIRDTMLVMTYSVVVFSIVAQGLTVSPLMRRWGLTGPASGSSQGAQPSDSVP